MKRRLVKITDGQQEIEQDIRPRIAVIREKLRAAGRVSVLRLPSLQEAQASLREITDGPMPESYQDRRNILHRIGDLRMTYLDGELEITGKVPIRTEPAESTTSNGKNWNHGQEHGFHRLFYGADHTVPDPVRVPGAGARPAAHSALWCQRYPTAEWTAQQLRGAFFRGRLRRPICCAVAIESSAQTL